MVILCLVVSAVWLGCSASKNYRLLSLFFDGVPDPNARFGSGDPSAVAKGGPIGGFSHKPYEDENCKACHANTEGAFFEATTVDSSVCLTCHQKVLGAHAVMHGPVEAKACLWCHAPHGSPYRGMLRAPGGEVCLQCHERQLLGSKPIEHKDAKASCLDCHVGHGGPRHMLLRADLPTTMPSPTTTPSPTTAPSALRALPGDGGRS